MKALRFAQGFLPCCDVYIKSIALLFTHFPFLYAQISQKGGASCYKIGLLCELPNVGSANII